MPVTEEQVREELKKVIDPELFVNIVDLGLIYVVAFEDGADGADAIEAPEAVDAPAALGAPDAPDTPAAPAPETPASEAPAPDVPASETPAAASDGVKVKIDMTMTSPMCPAGPQLVANSKQVVSQIEGVGEVEVRVVMDPPWTPDRMTDEAKDTLGIF